MERIIIVAGENKTSVCWLRRCLRERGYRSIPCRSAEQIEEEMLILTSCDAYVPLVVLDRNLLGELSDVLVNRFADGAWHVPLLLVVKLNEPEDLIDLLDRVCEYRIPSQHEQNPVWAEGYDDTDIQISYY